MCGCSGRGCGDGLFKSARDSREQSCVGIPGTCHPLSGWCHPASHAGVAQPLLGVGNDEESGMGPHVL